MCFPTWSSKCCSPTNYNNEDSLTLTPIWEETTGENVACGTPLRWEIKSGLLFLWKLDLILTQYLELLAPHAECLQETESAEGPLCIWECSPLYERGGSAQGSPLPIFPMIPHLTLRGMDAALLLAQPGYSPPSIALFDSPSAVWWPAAESLLSVGPWILASLLPSPPPPHTPIPSGLAKNPAPQAERRRRGVAPRPSLKSSKTKKKRKKTVLPGWPNAGLVVWQQDLWQGLRYCWSQANSLHSQELFPRTGLQTGRQRRRWKGGWRRKIRRQKTKRERRQKAKKAGWRHMQQQREMGSDSSKGNQGKKIRLKKRQETWRKKVREWVRYW